MRFEFFLLGERSRIMEGFARSGFRGIEKKLDGHGVCYSFFVFLFLFF